MAEVKYKLSFYISHNNLYGGNVSGTALITVVTGSSAAEASARITGETEGYYQITGRTNVTNTVWFTITNVSGNIYACVGVCRPLSNYAISSPVYFGGGVTAYTIDPTLSLTTQRHGAYVREDYVYTLDNVHELSPYFLYRSISNPTVFIGNVRSAKYQKGYELRTSDRLVAYDKNGNLMTTGAYSKEYVCSKGLHFSPNYPTVWKIYDTEPEDEPTPTTLRFSNNITGITITNNANISRTIFLSVTVGGPTDEIAFTFSGPVSVGTNTYSVTFNNRFWHNPGNIWCNLEVSGSATRNMKMKGTQDGDEVVFSNDYGGEGYHSATFMPTYAHGETIITSLELTLTTFNG